MHDTDWKTLKLVNDGPATRVPQLIQQLQTERRVLPGGRSELLEAEAEEKRRNALVVLRQGLVAEGKWCSASRPAAHLLLDLVASEKPGRPHALALLVDILCADHRRVIGSNLDLRDNHALEVASLVQSRTTDLVACLEAKDPLVRGAAGPVLAFVPEVDVTKLVRAFEGESNPEVRVSLLLALAHRLDWSEAADIVRGIVPANKQEAGGQALVRLAWGTGCDTAALGSPLVELLCQAGPAPGFAWARGSYVTVFERVVEHRQRTDVALEALLAGLATRDDWTKCRGVTKPILLFAGFVERWPDEEDIDLPTELTSKQREVAEAISLHAGLPGVGHGLPVTATERSRWLGKAVPGPLDRLVEGDVPLWLAIRQITGDSDWDVEQIPEVIEELPTLERIPVLGELCLNLYRAASNLDGDVLEARFEQEMQVHARELGAWCASFVDEVYSVTLPEHGELVWLGTPLAKAIFHGLSVNGLPLKPEWMTLVPWGGLGIRELFGNLPRDFAAEAIHMRLSRTYPQRELSTGVDNVLPLLDLVPTELVGELVIAKMLSKDGQRNVRNLEQELIKLRELARTEPGILAALERHGALESTPPPWDARDVP